MVSGDHDDLDSGSLALGHGRGDSGAGGVNQGHHTEVDEAELGERVDGVGRSVVGVQVADGEVGRAVTVGVGAVLVTGRVRLGVGELNLGESEDAEAVLGELVVQVVDLGAVFVRHGNDLSVDHHLVAPGDDALRGTLHVDFEERKSEVDILRGEVERLRSKDLKDKEDEKAEQAKEEDLFVNKNRFQILTERVDTLQKERKAISTIMEAKIKVLVNSAHSSASNLQAEGAGGEGIAPLMKDIVALKRLVQAAVAALANSS